MADLLEHFGSGHVPQPADRAPDAGDVAGTGPIEVPHRSASPRHTLSHRRARDLLLLAAGVAAGIIGLLGVQSLGQRLPSRRRPADPPDFGPDIDSSSIRSLAPAGAYSVYAARNVVDEYCLFLTVGDGGWASNCLGADALRATGLWISAPVTDPATGGSVDMTVSWSADELFMIGPSTGIAR